MFMDQRIHNISSMGHKDSGNVGARGIFAAGRTHIFDRTNMSFRLITSNRPAHDIKLSARESFLVTLQRKHPCSYFT